MNTNINNLNPMWLADKSVSAEMKAAYKDAALSRLTVMAVGRVNAAQRWLNEESGFHTELQMAISTSIANGMSVDDVLRDVEFAILDQVAAVKDEKRAFAEHCLARQVEMQPVLGKIAAEAMQLHVAIETYEARIRHYEQNRGLSKERLKSAGLSESQIEQVGLTPTPVDLAEWESAIVANHARCAQINQFQMSAPEYDLSLLDAAPAI